MKQVTPDKALESWSAGPSLLRMKIGHEGEDPLHGWKDLVGGLYLSFVYKITWPRLGAVEEGPFPRAGAGQGWCR